MTVIDQSDSQFRCCVYLHVRTGTIILGVFHILLQLIIVSTLLMAALKHDVLTIKSPLNVATASNCQSSKPPTDIFFLLMHVVPGFTIFHKSHSDLSARLRDETDPQPGQTDVRLDSNGFPDLMKAIMGEPRVDTVKNDVESVSSNPKTEIVLNGAPKSGATNRCFERRTNPYFSLCLALISLAFGYLLVHGVISRQPAHLLPFFCLQFFDFVVALICMLGFMSSASDIGHWLKYKIANQEGVSPSSVHLSNTSVSVILISTSCLILAFKAYCIGMVWDCHRYLLLTNNHGLLSGLPLPNFPRFSLFGFLSRRPFVMVRFRGDNGDGDDLSVPNVASDVTGVPTEPPKDSELPKYEEALMIPANAYAPPPYFAGKPSASPASSISGQESPKRGESGQDVAAVNPPAASEGPDDDSDARSPRA